MEYCKFHEHARFLVSQAAKKDLNMPFMNQKRSFPTLVNFKINDNFRGYSYTVKELWERDKLTSHIKKNKR